jgi:hypothetical protein
MELLVPSILLVIASTVVGYLVWHFLKSIRVRAIASKIKSKNKLRVSQNKFNDIKIAVRSANLDRSNTLLKNFFSIDSEALSTDALKLSQRLSLELISFLTDIFSKNKNALNIIQQCQELIEERNKHIENILEITVNQKARNEYRESQGQTTPNWAVAEQKRLLEDHEKNINEAHSKLLSLLSDLLKSNKPNRNTVAEVIYH